jgi:tetratricopeptide (TPR) repeat protein
MAETDFKYDVFVSYSSANKEWVRKTFVPILEKAGLKVCDYYRDFDPGAPIVKEMERAILESRKTILILSPAYLQSGWTEFENLMLQTLDAANQDRRLLPVIYEKCDLPLRFRYMNCINFDKPDDVEIEWQRLSRVLGVTLSPSLLDTKSPDTGSRDIWHLAHPYPMSPNFTGRAAEQKMLDDWLADDQDRLFILRALGGFGKSALAWQWINTHVNPTESTKLVWWSFYEGDASFEHFIEETLKYLKLEIPQGGRPQVDELLKAMQSQKTLLIMDGFERALRAYSSMNAAYQGDEEPKLEDNELDCVNINAEIFLKSVCSLPNIKSKVMMTTRLTPRAVKPRGEFMLGCREEELTAMQKEDAVAFFRKQGIKGNRTEIEAAGAPYGYHPLSLRLLAGRILKDFEKPADIVVAQKLKIDGDLKQQKHHVLEVSYNSLPQHEQKLLSTIACFRSPVEHKTLESIAEDKSAFDDDLHDLVERGLLHFDDKNKKFDLHPIVRRFAYDRLMALERTGVHVVLVVYFEAVPQPQKIEKLEDLAPVIELYHHTVRAGELDRACDLYYDRIWRTAYYQLGAYQTQIEMLLSLFPDGEENPPKLKKDSDRAWALDELANAYALSGQPRRAVPLFEMHNALREEANDKDNFATGLGNVASIAQTPIGVLREAERNLQRRIDLSHGIEAEFNEAVGHQQLGQTLSYRSAWQEAEQELDKSLELAEKHKHIQLQSLIWSYRALRFLLMARANSQAKTSNLKSGIQSASRALELADETAKTKFPHPRDYIRAHWLLGAAYCASSDLIKAEDNLAKAIIMCRQINMVDHEANILLDIARLRYDQKNYEEAKNLADEALLVTERCDYILQGADVNLFLAQYALEQEKDNDEAKQYAETALKLAYCDGPPYYYKVAYEEAERFLVQLKG